MLHVFVRLSIHYLVNPHCPLTAADHGLSVCAIQRAGPTMKLRRHAVLRKFSHLIDAMYAEQTQQLATPTPRHDVNNVAVVTSSNYVV